MSSKEENTPIVVETIPEFNKNYSTRTIYNELINNGYSTDAAIEKVCHKLDIFCSNTPNSIYLIDRYTEFYNHNKITKPLGMGLLSLIISLALNLGINTFQNETVANKELSLLSLLIEILKYVVPVLITVFGLKSIFKDIKQTYSSYDVFVIPYEQKRIYEELIKRGYTVPEIKE